ncbi:MAG: VWA domain-containing protein, partial [Bacteroidales bacterium]
VFEEERELTVMLLIDVSGSNLFGTKNEFKADLITELAAVLSFSAINNNDKVGVIFFSNTVEKFIPPKKGRSHILRIISELVNYEPTQSQTDIAEALRYMTNAIKKKCTAFLISDFVNSDFEQALKIAANKHDVVALHVMDQGEATLPDVGLIQLQDPETGKYCMIDTSDIKVRKTHATWWHEQRMRNKELFQKVGVDVADLYTNKDYVSSLTELFRRR